jgi:hypothetical protein
VCQHHGLLLAEGLRCGHRGVHTSPSQAVAGARAWKRSWAQVIGVASARLMSSLGPAAMALRMLPGTANTTRFASSAERAVMRAPLRSPPSTTIVASDMAAITCFQSK